jgi:ATP-dependent DNA helicase PIF1
MPICKIKAINNSIRLRVLDEDNFYGLLNILNLCINAKITLTTNLWIEHGLVNGATGTIKDIVFDENYERYALPIAVFIQFDYYTGIHNY